MTTLQTSLAKLRTDRSQPGLRRLTLSSQWLVLGALVFIGAGLRLSWLADKSLWLDEAFSLAISQREPMEIVRFTVLTDTHPPLYYLVFHLWLGGGTDERHLRLLSVLFSLVSIPAMYKLGALLYREARAGLIAAVVLTFSPLHIWYAQEARMYSMLTCLLLVSACFFVAALRGRSLLNWSGFTLATALALYTDNGAIWYVMALGLFYLLSVKCFPGTFLSWVMSQISLALLYLPWLPFLGHQTQQVTENFWLAPPTFQTVLNTFLDFNSFNFPWMAPGVLYITFILVWAYIVPNDQDWQRRLLTLWLFAPLAASLLFSLRQPIFLSRNLIAASLGYYLLIAGTLWQFRNTKVIAGLLLPLLMMNLVSIAHNFWRESKEDWRGAAAYVARSAAHTEGGLVVFVPGYAELPFHYYFESYALAVDTQGYPADEALLHPPAQPAAELDKLFADRPYVWLVLRDAETVDPEGSVKAWLDRHGYVRTGDFVREKLTVITYIKWNRLRSRSPRISIDAADKTP